MIEIKSYKKIKKLIKKKHLKIVLFVLLGLVAIGFLSLGTYSAVFAKKVYAHQYLGDTNYGGKTKTEIKDILGEKAKTFSNSQIELKWEPKTGDGKTYNIVPKDIGLQFDIDATIDPIWNYGRNGNILNCFWQQLKSAFKKDSYAMVYSYDEESLNKKIAGIAGEIDNPEKDYSLTYSSGKFVLMKERQAGSRIDQDEIKSNIKNKIASISFNQIVFQAKDYQPQIREDNAEKALVKANKALEKGDLTLKYNDLQFKADVDSIGGFIVSEQNGDDLTIVFNEERIKAYVDTIAKGTDVEEKNAKLTISGGKAAVFQAATVGRTLDKEGTKIDIENVLNARMDPSKADKIDLLIINLRVATIDPEITEQKINEMGIVELVGTAETNFKGSPSNRVHNIQTGANAINGVLLKPNETFSTLKQLGTIDASAGYLEELVIKENKTIPEFGGGLCQVSSTLFRAALNAGLKIVERQNHKYRVSYYEPPVGMDATIYDPSPDFKFLNNYGSHLLIQSKVVGTKITFEIYGTKDGRKAEISEPAVTDVIQPDPPLITETETLPPGERKKIDSAHPGATATFHYKVSRGSDILQERDFVSKYVPWQEKWLVGKGTPAPAPAPAPEPAPAPAPEPTPAPVPETPAPVVTPTP